MKAARLEKIYLTSGICDISQVPLFNNRTASPLVGEEEFQHEERVLEIQVRGNLRTSCILDPSPAFVAHCVHTTAASHLHFVTEAGSHNSFLVGSLCSSRGEAILP